MVNILWFILLCHHFMINDLNYYKNKINFDLKIKISWFRKYKL